MSGYDFSAYSLGLGELAKYSPGAHVFVLNDSMFGPFADFRPLMKTSPWDFCGLTASAAVENHIQSYSFMIRDLTELRLAGLSSALNQEVAFSHACATVENLEIPMARIAAASMKVGACWYADGSSVDDPCLRRPFELLEAGFPFMKKSLLGKMSAFQDIERSKHTLRDLGHPL
jgi:hypothetical protein